MTSRLKKASTGNQKYEWLEDDLNPSWSAFAASATSAAADITVTTGTGNYFNKYDLVKNPTTSEIMMVLSAGANAISAVRGHAGTTAASAAAAEELLILGSAFQEGSTSSMLVTKSTKVSNLYNYVQIVRKSVELSQSLAASELYGGNDREYQRKKKGIELMRDIERIFLYGGRTEYVGAAANEDVNLTTTRRTTGGLLQFISTNATDMSGVMTETEFEAFLRDLFLYGENDRTLFCSPLVLSVISLWAQPKLQMLPKDKTYGIAINQYMSPQGTVNLVRNMLLEGNVYGGYAFGLQMSELTYRYLNGRDIKFMTNIHHPGDDMFKDQYIGEIGLELHQEKLHGYLYGVSG